MKIYKYRLELTDRQTISLPVRAELLDVQIQNGQLCLWAMVEPDAPKTSCEIEIIGTGHEMDHFNEEDLVRHHLATIQTQGGAFVWHVFELI